ncbi:MAG: rane protein of unknown function [Candidatus Saccharibacteria bacterium]|nr:rane protein of unknown function [Candidatus Saccharibacteria bacterium]
MSIFVKAQPAPGPVSRNVQWLALGYAGLLTILALTQLYSFEDDILLFGNALPDGFAFVAPLIVVSEVFALPYLLRLQLSPAMRVLSMGLGWVAALSWIVWPLIFMGTAHPEHNSGLLGVGLIDVPLWWTIIAGAAMLSVIVTISKKMPSYKQRN